MTPGIRVWLFTQPAQKRTIDAHARRRVLVELVIARIGRPQRSSSPAAALLDAMGLAPGLEPDVAAVALAYQPYAPVPPFGAGRHACPGQALALHLADAGHQ